MQRLAGNPGSVFVARRLVRAAISAAVAMAAVLFVVFPGYAAGTRTIDIEIRQGKVVGERSARVSRGDVVILRWRSDQPLELHLHGYDLKTTVNPGKPAEMKVQARASGRFPVEKHGQAGVGGHGHAPLFHLEVYPD